MKKTLILSIAALVAMGSIINGCSKEEKPQPEKNVVTKTATISLNGKSNTKALTAGGVKTFAAGEQMAVIYKNTGGTTVKAVSDALKDDGDITNAGKSAKFSVTLEDPDMTQNVTYIYPAAMANADGTVNYDALATQDGTLSSLASNLDYCTLTAAWDGTSLPNGTLENQFAICAFTLKNSDGSSEITNTITGLTISDGTNTYTVTRSATDGPIYVAMRPTTSANIWITATDGSKNYCKSLTAKTYEDGNGYNLALRMMTYHDLKDASFDDDDDAYIFQTDAASESTNHTITIYNGRKVVLTGVNIKAENTNAINCLGSAEIVLSGTNTVTSESDPLTSGTLNFAVIKAGTYEPTKTTLTISGDGILNAYPVYRSGATSPAHNGAVIGADYEGSCGNIVINSGTITVSNNYGAAIGSGRVSTGTSKCGSITINGGTISATGSTGAGIGSGGRAWVSSNRGTTSCDGITINGGNVTARSIGGAAIGAGKCEGGGTNSDSYCGNILITGGIIDARTSAGSNADGGAAIGGGYHSKAGTITISGGNVTAVGSSRSAGIGSGSRNSQCGNILIDGGSVDAQGGYNFKDNEGAGIGTGRGSANSARSICGTITITNTVTIVKAYNVYGNSNRKNIGKGALTYVSCGTVTIGGVSGEIAGGSQYVYQP